MVVSVYWLSWCEECHKQLTWILITKNWSIYLLASILVPIACVLISPDGFPVKMETVTNPESSVNKSDLNLLFVLSYLHVSNNHGSQASYSHFDFSWTSLEQTILFFCIAHWFEVSTCCSFSGLCVAGFPFSIMWHWIFTCFWEKNNIPKADRLISIH